MLGADDGLQHVANAEGAHYSTSSCAGTISSVSIEAADATLHSDSAWRRGGDSVSDQYYRPHGARGKAAPYHDKLREAVQEARSVDRTANYWAARDHARRPPGTHDSQYGLAARGLMMQCAGKGHFGT